MATLPVLSKVHTFAQDLERVRGAQSRSTPKPLAPADTTATSKEPSTPTTSSVEKTVISTDGPIKLTAASGRDTSYPATIITDKKRHTFNLTEEVSAAVGDWWNEKIKSIKGGKKPVYSIAAVERRKGVIETATTHTGRIATSDHREVVAKLKKESTIPTPTVPFSSTPAAIAVPPVAPSFVALDETLAVGYQSEDNASSTASISVVPDATPEPIHNEKVLEPVALPITATVPEVVMERPIIAPSMPEFVVPSSDRPDDITEEEETGTLTEMIGPTITVPPPVSVTPLSFPKINPRVPAPVNPTPSIVSPLPVSRENAFSMLAEVPKPALRTTSSQARETIANRLKDRTPESTKVAVASSRLFVYAPYIIGGVFVVITAGSIGYFMFTGTTPSTTEQMSTDLPITTITDVFPNGTYTPSSVTAQLDAPNKNSLFTAINEASSLGDGLLLVTPLAHDTAFPLESREILSLLNRQLSADFIGNIVSVQLGQYRTEPVILISISDENSARGGMFRWETTLSKDLSPWFGPNLLSDTSSSVTGFSDLMSAGRDVRVLQDDLGTERITYGFINQSVILITTNTTAFLNVADTYTDN